MYISQLILQIIRFQYNLVWVSYTFLQISGSFIYFIYMAAQLNGSSYYRANPFYQQGYLPDSAFKNRKSPNFMVQIPQGNQYFEPTNKKHFQRVGYYSTIAEEGIINKELINSPARQKEYFRSLNVEDIEGTSTNTLISQAVKNKLKAKQQLAQRQREQEQHQAKEKKQYFQRIEDQTKRMEALTKFNRKGQPNYHEKVMKLKTQESERKLSPEIKKVSNSEIQNYHNQKYDKFKSQLQRTESEIKQLERQLRQGAKQPSNHISHQYLSLPPKQSHSQLLKAEQDLRQQREYKQVQKKYQNERVLSNNNYTPFDQYEQISPGRISQQDIASKLNKLQGYGMQGQNQIYAHPPNAGNIQNNKEINRQRPYTEKVPNFFEKKGNSLGLNGSEQISDSRLMKIQHDNPIAPSTAQFTKQTKEQHRRHNPTYLSYGSPAIGLAGRNIVGY